MLVSDDVSNDEFATLYAIMRATTFMNSWVIISEDDKDLIDSTWRLNASGYVYRTFNGKIEYMHRKIGIRKYGVIPDDYVIDHVDGNRENNTRDNLRLATSKENQINSASYRTDFDLDYIEKKDGKWSVTLDNTYYDDINIAISHKNTLAISMFGEFYPCRRGKDPKTDNVCYMRIYAAHPDVAKHISDYIQYCKQTVVNDLLTDITDTGRKHLINELWTPYKADKLLSWPRIDGLISDDILQKISDVYARKIVPELDNTIYQINFWDRWIIAVTVDGNPKQLVINRIGNTDAILSLFPKKIRFMSKVESHIRRSKRQL